MIRVLIVDDDPGIRVTLGRWCAYQPDLRVVGEASNGEDAVTVAQEVPADVIVMDVKMPKLSGLQATKRIRRLGINTPVLIFSAEDGASGKLGSLGAVRFLSKAGAGSRETLQAIRSIARGA